MRIANSRGWDCKSWTFWHILHRHCLCRLLAQYNAVLNRASAVRTSIYTRGYSDLVPGSRRMFVVLIQSSALTRAMSNELLLYHWLVVQYNDQWQRARDTWMVFRAPKADYVVIFSAQRVEYHFLDYRPWPYSIHWIYSGVLPICFNTSVKILPTFRHDLYSPRINSARRNFLR